MSAFSDSNGLDPLSQCKRTRLIVELLPPVNTPLKAIPYLQRLITMDTARRNDRQNRTTPPSTAQPGASAPKKRIRAQRRQRRRQHQQPSYYITNLPVWLQQPSPIPQPIYVPVQSNVNQYGLSASASFIHLYANPYIYGKLWCRLHPLPIH